MRILIMSGVAMLCLLVQTAQADSDITKSGINEFAGCSRQCVAENEKCKKERQADCKKGDDSCFEVCDIAYPDCMAKCPRPGG